MISKVWIIQNWEMLTSTIGVGFALYFSMKFYFSRKYHLRELKALGLFQEETKEIMDNKRGIKDKRIKSIIKVSWKKNKLIFSSYNRAFGLDDFERLKPKLETLFGKKIELITAEKSWMSSQPRIICHCEVFPKVYLLSQRPKLKVGDLFLGIDGLNRHVILDAIDDFQNSLVLMAPKGSGKSILINGMLKAFFETLEENQRAGEYHMIVIDNKGTDFIDVVRKYNGKYYQPFNIDDLREVVAILEKYKSDVEKTLLFFRQNQISPRHWKDIRGKFGCEIPTPLLIVADEFKQYWGSGRINPKVTKDSPQEIIDAKEKFDLQNRLGILVNFIAEQCRPTGSIIVVASQSPKVTDYDYPDISNFPIMVLGKTNQQVSIQLIGDSSLNDNSLTKGKFVIKDEIGVRRFIAPLSIEIGGSRHDAKRS